MTAPQRTNVPIIAGIFVLISACLIAGLTLIDGYITLIHGLGRAYFSYFTLPHIAADLMLVTVALVGGVTSILRKEFALTIVGAAFVFAISILTVPGYFAQVIFATTGDFVFLLSATPFLLVAAIALILSFFGLILIAQSRAEFT